MTGDDQSNPVTGWYEDHPDPRAMQRVSIGGTSIEIEVMIYRQGTKGRHPFVIINSIDFPMPPSLVFCEQMWAAGYQVVFVRRPGFGRTPGLPMALLTQDEVRNRSPIAAETALIKLLFERLELKDITLMGLGTSNSICFRLAQICPDIQVSVYANPLFHPAIWDVIRPPWLKRMIRQTVLSRSGLKIAVKGLKAVLRRDSLWFYRQFAQKSAGDLAYLAANESDFQYAGLFLQRIEPETFYYDLRTALIEDTRWDADLCRRTNAVILSGAETTASWKDQITAEAARLGLPIEFAPSGDLFVPYASPDTLLDVLARSPALAIRSQN